MSPDKAFRNNWSFISLTFLDSSWGDQNLQKRAAKLFYDTFVAVLWPILKVKIYLVPVTTVVGFTYAFFPQ